MPNDYRFIGVPAQTGTPSRYNVMIETPVGHRPYAGYAISLAATVHALAVGGIRYQPYLHQGNCHVDDARNEMMRDFLESDCTDLFFVDDDLDWRPENFMRLLTAPGDIVAGIYCHRSDGETYPFHPGKGVREANVDGLYEMFKVPTGFMRLRRHVVEVLHKREVDKGRKWWRRVPEKRAGKLPIARIVERGFACELGLKEYAGEDYDYHSGDYVLCLKAKALGFSVLADIEMEFGHAGERVWVGHLGNHLRRQQRVDHPRFEVAAQAIMVGDDNLMHFEALAKFSRNAGPWGLPGRLLQRLYWLAKASEGDVLECGSGLSTLVIAAALQGTGRKLYTLEHDLNFMRMTGEWLERNSMADVEIRYAPLLPYEHGDWYGVDPDSFPEHFGLLVIDGPPREMSKRDLVFEVLGNRAIQAPVWAIDDAADLQLKVGRDTELLTESGHTMMIARQRKPIREAAE